LADFRGERVLLCDLQNSSKNSRIAEQKGEKRSELSAQTLREKAQRKNAWASTGTGPSAGKEISHPKPCSTLKNKTKQNKTNRLEWY
jgi:hypothetical protein